MNIQEYRNLKAQHDFEEDMRYKLKEVIVIDNNEFLLVQKVLDDVRRDFPIREHTYTFTYDLHNLIARRVNEVCDNIEQKYKKEFEEWERDFERSCNGKNKTL